MNDGYNMEFCILTIEVSIHIWNNYFLIRRLTKRVTILFLKKTKWLFCFLIRIHDKNM